MARGKTRRSPNVWLIGKPSKDILGSRLQTNKKILTKFLFHHQEEGLTFAESAKVTIDAVMVIWDRARIPVQRVDSGVRKLRILYNKYCLLKKNRLNTKEGCRVKEELFQCDLEELFDISRKDASNIMKNEEDKKFLHMQQEDPSSSSMVGIDKSLTMKENRKRARMMQENERKQRHKTKEHNVHLAPLQAEALTITTSNESSSESDEVYEVPQKRKGNIRTKPLTVVTKDVAASLDRVNISNRKAMFVVSAVTQALGCNLKNVVLSRNSIQRSRVSTRQESAKTEQALFSPSGPIILHWDGKLLPDITGGKETVDRVAIVATGGGIEQLLGVPKINRGTGKEQCNACVQVLEEWRIKCNVQGLVFDTTAANTGIRLGTCTLLEKALNKELVWIACRHHIFEVMLSNVFTYALGKSSGPENILFKRIQKNWKNIMKDDYRLPSESLFVSMPDGLQREVVLFCKENLKG